MQNLFNKIIKISIYLLVFLLPLFWLPFTFEAFEFNKQYLLFFLASLAFFAWIAKMALVDKEIRFKRTPLDIPVLAFLFIAILSTIFSADKGSSLFGFYGRFSDGLIGLLSLGIFYFLITNNTQINTDRNTDKHRLNVSGILKAFLWSSFFTILLSYLSAFGIWAKLQSLTGLKLPLAMLQRTFNPASGSMEGLAIFLSALAVLIVSQICFFKWTLKQLGYWILLIAALGLLIIVDFTSAWIVLILVLTLFLIFALATRMFKENINKLLLPIFLIVIAIFFLSTNIVKNVFPLPQEQILNRSQSWTIGLKAAIDDIKSGFLGSGIGNWHYDFAKFKPVEFNQNLLWQIRFDRAGSYIAEILGNMGFLGILSYLFLIGMFLLVSYFFLQQNRSGVPLFLALFALLVGQFVYYQNTVLAFTFWLFLGLSVISWQRPIAEKAISFKDFPELSLVFSVFLVVLGLAIFGFYFFAGKFYLADVAFANAFRTADTFAQITNLEKAIKLNPYQPQYKIILARTYLNQALSEMGKPINEQDAIKIQNGVAKAIEQARIATEISPNNVAAWETRGIIYREIREPVATGALEWAIKSFEKAITLEPTNPVLHTELGKLLLVDKPEEAKKKFEKALELKSNYSDAKIQLALIFEEEGNFPEAISKLQETVSQDPLNIEAIFQLGRVYYNNNQTDEAISQFQQAILIFPNHSNSLYALGLAWQKKGQKEEALKMFEKVLELNPGNQDVIAKIEELKK